MFAELFNNYDTIAIIAKYLARIFVVMLVLSVHEFFHAFAAIKNGDLTAKFHGRYTLNPIRHFDPWGLVMCVFVGIGWAKPVPINPNNFNNYKKGLVWTSIAGVLSNLAMAFIGYAFVLLYEKVQLPGGYPLNPFLFFGYALGYYLVNFFYLFNLSICIFNLIPLYPLDGFRLWDALDRKRGQVFQFIEQYGRFILLGLLLLHYGVERFSFLGYIDLLGYLMKFGTLIFSTPITYFWNFLFGLI